MERTLAEDGCKKTSFILSSSGLPHFAETATCKVRAKRQAHVENVQTEHIDNISKCILGELQSTGAYNVKKQRIARTSSEKSANELLNTVSNNAVATLRHESSSDLSSGRKTSIRRVKAVVTQTDGKYHQHDKENAADADKEEIIMDLRGVYDKFVSLALPARQSEDQNIANPTAFTYQQFVTWLHENNTKANMSSLGWMMKESTKLRHYDAYMEFLMYFFDYLVEFLQGFGEDKMEKRLFLHSKSFFALWKASGGYLPNGWCTLSNEKEHATTLVTPIMNRSCYTKTTKGIYQLVVNQERNTSNILRSQMHRNKIPSHHSELQDCSSFGKAISVHLKMDPNTVCQQLKLRGMKYDGISERTRCERLAMTGRIEYELLPSTWFVYDPKAGMKVIADEEAQRCDNEVCHSGCESHISSKPYLRARMFVRNSASLRIDLAYMEHLVQTLIDWCADESLYDLYVKVVLKENQSITT